LTKVECRGIGGSRRRLSGSSSSKGWSESDKSALTVMCRSIHCLAHGQVLETDNVAVAGPDGPSDDATAENIVAGHAGGDAEMVHILILSI